MGFKRRTWPPLKWRNGGGSYHYYESSNRGYGFCWQTITGRWGASASLYHSSFDTLGEAKAAVEKAVRGIRRDAERKTLRD